MGPMRQQLSWVILEPVMHFRAMLYLDLAVCV